MKKLLIFDPPLCCPTGVCGPSVDPELTRIAADLDWLQKKGIEVGRYNLAQEPGEFVANETVKNMLAEKGNDCLPLTLADDQVIASGSYPSRMELAEQAGIEYEKPAIPVSLPMAGPDNDDGCC